MGLFLGHCAKIPHVHLLVVYMWYFLIGVTGQCGEAGDFSLPQPPASAAME